MTDHAEINKALLHLAATARACAGDHAIALNVRITWDALRVEWETQNPDALRKGNITMRNLKGEWIK